MESKSDILKFAYNALRAIQEQRYTSGSDMEDAYCRMKALDDDLARKLESLTGSIWMRFGDKRSDEDCARREIARALLELGDSSFWDFETR